MKSLTKKIGKGIYVHTGSIIDYETIRRIGDLKKITNYLRKETYKLDPDYYI